MLPGSGFSARKNRETSTSERLESGNDRAGGRTGEPYFPFKEQPVMKWWMNGKEQCNG